MHYKFGNINGEQNNVNIKCYDCMDHIIQRKVLQESANM